MESLLAQQKAKQIVGPASLRSHIDEGRNSVQIIQKVDPKVAISQAAPPKKELQKEIVIKPATKTVQVVAKPATKEEIASIKPAAPKQNLV